LSLIRQNDCYVSLHGSEGFELGMAEAMALGKPVIGTDYCGNT
jgi:glycosyltransferase involved in cell wall biosynthesis